MRGTERVLQKIPLKMKLLPIVTRKGRGLQARSAQRIERVARRAAPMVLNQSCLGKPPPSDE